MHWVEVEPPVGRRISRSAATQILRAAIEKSPARRALHERLGGALMEEGKYRAAIAAFRARLQAEPAQFTSWGKLAQCHLEIGEPESALEICGLVHGQGVGVARARGGALEALGRSGEALEEYRRAFAEDGKDEAALEAVLRCLCRKSDAAPLLAFCDALPAATRYEAQRKAFRALAFSRLGRLDEARDLMDPERHAMTFRFEPPAACGAVEQFSARLAAWLTANTGSVATPRPDCVIDYGLKYTSAPLLQELHTFFRDSFEAYVAALPALGLGGLMPPPAAGSLADAVVFLRNEGRNGEHVHPRSYLSGVYYVQVPETVRTDSDRRGWLALGRCLNLTAGYEPAWGTRYIKPEPGMFVVFPSHLFHDVVPTRSNELRISIAVDMRPFA
ncbi:MAG: putative 2OG-Fe(II) oxygenase [Xanthobacteraceae bacterium]